MSKLQDTWQDLPGWGKALTVGAGAFIAWKLWKVVSGDDDKSGGTSHQGGGIDPGELTYSQNDYEIFADGIEAAVWGSLMWEDDSAVGDILQLMWTDDDVYKLIQVYGIRGVGVIIEEKYNLPATVQMYLDDDVKEEVNQTYAQRGISVRWL